MQRTVASGAFAVVVLGLLWMSTASDGNSGTRSPQTTNPAATAGALADVARVPASEPGHWPAAHMGALPRLLDAALDRKGEGATRFNEQFRFAAKWLVDPAPGAAYDVIAIRRERSGRIERPIGQAQLYFALEGNATLWVGGQIADEKQAEGLDGILLGTRLDRAQAIELRAGDFASVPPGWPHHVVVAEGGKFSYLLVRINDPSRR
jgi:mannose-6-phosphate isomerase-like protein (cupin superfamily)